MSESVFKEILGESLRREFSEFDRAPEHKFSLRHRIAMNKIFARYEKNTRKFIELSAATLPHYGLKQRVIFVLVMIIILTLLTGWFIPIRGITDAQIDWLRAKYDFPNMKMYVVEYQNFDIDPNSPFSLVSFSKKTDEYCDFLDDLVELEIYSQEELHAIEYKAMPIDKRPYSFMDKRPDGVKNKVKVTEMPQAAGEDTPLEYAHKYIAYLEEIIDYYIERSKDPSRAVEGDAEFAELIREQCWELYHGYVELLERLFADDTDNSDDSDNKTNSLFNYDKDDKRYLLEINKI